MKNKQHHCRTLSGWGNSITVFSLPAVWDEIILVEYPSRMAFEQMISSSEYQVDVIHRTAALEDSRLFVATLPQRIERLAWCLRKLALRFRR